MTTLGWDYLKSAIRIVDDSPVLRNGEGEQLSCFDNFSNLVNIPALKALDKFISSQAKAVSTMQ